MTDQRVNAAAAEVEMETFGALRDKEPQKEPRSQWKDVWDQLRKHKGALIGGGFLLFITLFVLVGPWVWRVDPKALDIRNKDLRPIYTLLWDGDAKTLWSRPLGTDNLGRDIMATLIAGGRASLAVGWAAMVLSLLLGTVVGVCAGYFKKLDGILMRITDSVPVPADPAFATGGCDAVSPTVARSFRARGGDVHSYCRRDCHHILDANRAHCTRRNSGPEGAGIRSGSPIYRDQTLCDHQAAPAAQCDLAHHGVGHAGSGHGNHRGKCAIFPWRGLPVRLSHVGKALVGCCPAYGRVSRTGDAAGDSHLGHRIVGELPR